MSDELLARSPKCVQRRHEWGERKETSASAAGTHTRQACPLCGAVRLEFRSNHRAYGSYVKYRAGRDPMDAPAKGDGGGE